MSDLFVEPDELRAAVGEVAAAAEALGRARGSLEHAGGLVDVDEVDTFVRQWRSECELIGDFLGAFREILSRAADCYEGLDDELACCIADAGG